MPFEQKLENGLLLRTVRDEIDIDRYVAFNSIYNNVNEGLNTNILLHYYPGARIDDYQLIEDEQSGEMLATTCLIPWQFEFDGIPLRAAQLEQVLSHPAYRRHGLVKIQIKRFMRAVAEREFDFSFIWGIPYYYRQYGYGYCIEGNAYESLPAWRIPTAASDPDCPLRLRSAGLADAALLTKLYRAAMKPLKFHITRDQAHWRYLLEHARFPVQIVEDIQTGSPLGYIGLVKQPENKRISILESGVTTQTVAWGVLRALKTQTDGEIQVCWPQRNSLARLAHSLGGVTTIPGQWLFHIHDLAAFLTKIGPVLERRLAASDFVGLTRDLVINLFRQAYQLSFKSGRLSAIQSLGFVDSSMGADGGDLCIPPDAFTRLLLGFRDLDQLLDAWPDIVVKPDARLLIQALFPRMDSYLYATYAYFG